jgi:hypothetical protein
MHISQEQSDSVEKNIQDMQKQRINNRNVYNRLTAFSLRYKMMMNV